MAQAEWVACLLLRPAEPLELSAVLEVAQLSLPEDARAA
jgi:hypothetical protein